MKPPQTDPQPHNWKLTLAYDGTDFNGWQVQPGKPTVQGELQAALCALQAKILCLKDRDGRMPGCTPWARWRASPCKRRSRRRISIAHSTGRSPGRSILEAQAAPADFHARHAAVAKTYEYCVHLGENCLPFLARYVYCCRWPMDTDALAAAASAFVGEHDFLSFAASDPDLTHRHLEHALEAKAQAQIDPPTAIRTVFSSEWERRHTDADELLVYRIRGNGFLHHMVRNLVGTMIEVGRGRWQPEEVAKILAARNRSAAGPHSSGARTLSPFGGISFLHWERTAGNGSRTPPATLKLFLWRSFPAAPPFPGSRRWPRNGRCMPPSPGCMEILRKSWTGRRGWWRSRRLLLAKRLGESGWLPALPRLGSATSKPTLPATCSACCAPPNFPLKAPAPIVVLSAHLDTVFPAETPIRPVVSRVDGSDRLEAPGACDNGAGLVGMLAIAHALVQAKTELPAPLLFLGNVGEEGEGDLRGVRHLYQQSALAGRIATHIVLDGAGADSAVTQALGSRRFQVTIHGPGGHSFTDAGTPNPIAALASALAVVAQTPLPEEPRTTLNLGTIRGGTSVNSIPETAMATIDFRSTDPDQLLRLEVALHRAVEDSVEHWNACAKAGMVRSRGALNFRIDKIGDRPAAFLAGDSALLETLRAVDRHLGLHTDLRLGSTDANIPLSLGVQSVSLGAGGEGGGAHTQGEWYSDKDREVGLRRVLLLTLAMLEWAADQ